MIEVTNIDGKRIMKSLMVGVAGDRHGVLNGLIDDNALMDSFASLQYRTTEIQCTNKVK
jgi:hypothetical protein